MDADVIVIGGGPGGTTTATLLARKGWRVLLFERARFPRDHVGESLLPASMPLLEDLGVMDQVAAAGFLQKWGATMVWGSGTEPWSWFFSETNHRYPHAFQVWRPEFDRILLENSREHGVDVHEGHRVLEVTFDGDCASGVRYQSEGGEEGTAAARFVVDASGQAGLLGRTLRLRQQDPAFRNLAVYAYFEGASQLPEPAQNNILVESFDGGWCWAIPLHTGWMSVGAVVDSTAGQEGISNEGPAQFLAAQVRRAPHLSAMLERATMAAGPHVVRDWSYTSSTVAGDGYVLVGDAACFVDPLFSSGVHLAMSAGVLASAYVTSALKDRELAEAAAHVYQELYYQQYNQFRELARLFYGSNRSVDSYFWEARRITGDDEGVNPRQAFVRAVAGQPPQGYERAVLERGVLPDAFATALDDLEAARTSRRAAFDRLLNGDAEARQLLLQSRPRAAEGVTLERKPVLTDGEFEWGDVITTPARPEGNPVSPLVATLVSTLDGDRTVADALREMTAVAESDQRDAVLQSTLGALQILFVDGAIRGLPEQ